MLFLSRVFRESGDLGMAQKVLRRALKIRPDDPALVQEMCLMKLTNERPTGRKLLDRFRKG